MMILVVGPDGSGKSTFTKTLISESDLEFLLVHSYPRLRLVAIQTTALPVSDPHAHPARGLMSSLLKVMIIYTSWLWFYVRTFGTRKVILVERGWYDMVVDPKRYRIDSRLGWVLASLGRLLPKPNLAVILSVQATTVLSRKQELTQREIERQTLMWISISSAIARESIIYEDSILAAHDALSRLCVES